MTDEEATAMLAELKKHFHEPVMPISRYCDGLRTWQRALDERAERTKDKSHRGMADDVAFIFMQIGKSALLDRLLYGGEKLRTEMCPKHQGHWSGLPGLHNDCEHGCELTGWLPVPTGGTE